MEELNGRAEMEMRKAGEELMRKAAAKKKAEAENDKKRVFVSPRISTSDGGGKLDLNSCDGETVTIKGVEYKLNKVKK